VYTALPDGCVDLVLEVAPDDHRAWIYGTTSRPTQIACSRGTHYLGIRFQPGQSRHFIHADACELTDTRAELHSLMSFPAEMIGTRLTSNALFSQLDAIFTATLSYAPPEASLIDQVIRHVEDRHGIVSVDTVARQFGKSRRQLERTFSRIVGVPLKFFCTLARLRHAAQLIARPSRRPLAAIASDAGYSDQAHMTRDFRRLAGGTPARMRDDDAFFQYHAPR
jgi:AraC-like DNA-binding protein